MVAKPRKSRSPKARPPVEFWFDFSSPYAFFASREIDAVAVQHGREVVWRPFLLGVVFKTTEMAPLTQQPLRGAYGQRDWQRIGRLRAVHFKLPHSFPANGLHATRMFYAIERDDAGRAIAYAKAAFEALFVDGRDIGNPEIAAEVGGAIGLDPAALHTAAESSEVRDIVRARTGEAIERGVFGAPFFIADGEPFWGWDRLPMLDEWLTRGGW